MTCFVPESPEPMSARHPELDKHSGPPAEGDPGQPPGPVPQPDGAASAVTPPAVADRQGGSEHLGSEVQGRRRAGLDQPSIYEPSAATARRRMSLQGTARTRLPPTDHQQARRHRLLLWTKWLLPAGALLLLGSIAAWPELNRSLNAGTSAAHQMAGVNLDTGRMLGPRYHGRDVHGRPYTITADSARQITPDHLDLVQPVADTLTQNGTWMLVRAQTGVYMPHTQILDLFGHVSMYRDDGTLMTSPTAVMDVRRGIVATDDWVHVEGPFGVLDAQGDLIAQHDGIAQFRGPARMILNDDHTAAPTSGAAGASQGSAR